MVEVLVRGQSFERKVMQALDVWTTLRPWEGRQFREDMKADRERLKRPSGMESSDPDGIGAFGSIPPFVDELLSMSEFKTQFMYGKPCGTGNKCWRTVPGNLDIFFQICRDGKVTNKTGLPRFAREAG